MDNLYTVLCYVVSAVASVGAIVALAKSGERVCLARWDAGGQKEALERALVEGSTYKAAAAQLEKELSRAKSENEKLRQLPPPKTRF